MTARRPAPGPRTAARRERSRSSTRGTLIALLVVGLLLSAAYPGRQLLAEESRIAALRAEDRALAERLRTLRTERALLQTDDEIERLAREHLGMVRPGEVAFAVAARPAAPQPVVASPAPDDVAMRGDRRTEANRTDAPRPWYAGWWNGLARAAREHR